MFKCPICEYESETLGNCPTCGDELVDEFELEDEDEDE